MSGSDLREANLTAASLAHAS
ncbi:MAG: hypothetical protein M3454_11270 [Actinomycetota bacterium]|nr:hypothetical protein [Actinomycetota bacterium]